MKIEEFNNFVDNFRLKQDEILKTKGRDYTQAQVDDRLSNFKDVANLIGLSPIQVWSIYWLKHVFAICTFVKTDRLESESIESRFLDEMNYSLLGAALIEEVELKEENVEDSYNNIVGPTSGMILPENKSARVNPKRDLAF